MPIRSCPSLRVEKNKRTRKTANYHDDDDGDNGFAGHRGRCRHRHRDRPRQYTHSTPESHKEVLSAALVTAYGQPSRIPGHALNSAWHISLSRGYVLALASWRNPKNNLKLTSSPAPTHSGVISKNNVACVKVVRGPRRRGIARVCRISGSLLQWA